MRRTYLCQRRNEIMFNACYNEHDEPNFVILCLYCWNVHFVILLYWYIQQLSVYAVFRKQDANSSVSLVHLKYSNHSVGESTCCYAPTCYSNSECYIHSTILACNFIFTLRLNKPKGLHLSKLINVSTSVTVWSCNIKHDKTAHQCWRSFVPLCTWMFSNPKLTVIDSLNSLMKWMEYKNCFIVAAQ